MLSAIAEDSRAGSLSALMRKGAYSTAAAQPAGETEARLSAATANHAPQLLLQMLNIQTWPRVAQRSSTLSLGEYGPQANT